MGQICNLPSYWGSAGRLQICPTKDSASPSRNGFPCLDASMFDCSVSSRDKPAPTAYRYSDFIWLPTRRPVRAVGAGLSRDASTLQGILSSRFYPTSNDGDRSLQLHFQPATLFGS